MSLESEVLVLLASAFMAAAVMLVAWALFDIGTHGFARYRKVFTERAGFSLRELFLFVEPGKLFLLNLALMLLMAVLVFALTASVSVALPASALAALLPRFILRRLMERRRTLLEQQLPDALLMLAGAMKAGVSLTQAVAQLVAESLPPLSQEFDLALREQRLGVSLDQALENLLKRVPLQSVTLAVSAMRIATDTGGQLAETLERTSQTLRNKLAMEGKIRALTSQGKMQAWVVGSLPLFLMFILTKMEPVTMGLLFTTQVGWATLVVVALLEFFGVLMIRRIVAIDV